MERPSRGVGMGATKVSVSDTQLDEIILKSDFPKLKVAETAKMDSAATNEPTNSAQNTLKTPKISPIWTTYVSLGVLVAQVGLFLATAGLIRGFYRDLRLGRDAEVKGRTLLVNPTANKQVSSAKSELASQAGKGDLSRVRTQFKGVVSDFNDGSLHTFSGGLIEVYPQNGSKSVQLASDAEVKSGTFGNSLKIDYSFVDSASRPAIIRFNVPNLLVSPKQRVFVRMKLAEPEMVSPDIQWSLIDDKGVSYATPKSNAYVFWKRYELPLLKSSEISAPLNIVALEMLLSGSKNEKPAGTIYIDDVALE